MLWIPGAIDEKLDSFDQEVGARSENPRIRKLIPEYEQSNVRVMGLKAGPGASIIVSNSRSRLGIKFPFIYNIQRFQNPPSSTGYKIEELNPLSYMATLYSRFQFGKWYLQTEFGKYLTEERSVWAIGIGKEF